MSSTDPIQGLDYDFHVLEIQEALTRLETSNNGLSSEEVKFRTSKYGYNEIIEKRRQSPFQLLLDQFKDFLVVILLLAALVSLLLGLNHLSSITHTPTLEDYENMIDALVILAIVLAAAILGFTQEFRAEKAIEALKSLAAPTCEVQRDGEMVSIAAKLLVPGDILFLHMGDKIPADGRLVEAVNLRTDESPLTGESTPVDKDIKTLSKVKTPVYDKINSVFSGTIVTYGRGKAAITHTGMKTELGKIATMLQETVEEETPLQKRLAYVGKWIGISALLVCAIVTILGIWRELGIQGSQADLVAITLDRFIWGVSLAVAAVPEALPAVVVIALSIGVQRMSKRNAIVRNLGSVETLGCTTVICSDKTGTLTKNEMTVIKIWTGGELFGLTGTGFSTEGGFTLKGENVNPGTKPALIETLLAGVICNDSRLKTSNPDEITFHGDPTELALIISSMKAGLSQNALSTTHPRVWEIPFSSETKRMLTIHNEFGSLVAYAKGAPEAILPLCNSYIDSDGQVVPITPEIIQKINQVNDEMTGSALRVLGTAKKQIEEIFEEGTEQIEPDMIFLGLQAMLDPPRDEVTESIRQCKNAGIRPIMITGDHKATATAIAIQLGILDNKNKVMTGEELDQISDEELPKTVQEVQVFARTSPHHKSRIVEALQKQDEIVAMTGDGINDAPALKRASIGIAMGITGTDVAKEASDIILADDNFASIVGAVEEGRGIFENITKYLAFLLSSNAGEILVLLVATLLGFAVIPLIALQILWINLVTDGLPAIALSVDPMDSNILNRPPRDPQQGVFTKGVLILILTVAVLMTIIIMPIFAIYLNPENFLDPSLATYFGSNSSEADRIKHAQTMVFTSLVMAEMWNALNCRSIESPLISVGVFKNKWLYFGIFSSIILQMAVIYVAPLNVIFKTFPLTLFDWILTIALTSLVFIVVEVGKIVLSLYHEKSPNPQHIPV